MNNEREIEERKSTKHAIGTYRKQVEWMTKTYLLGSWAAGSVSLKLVKK